MKYSACVTGICNMQMLWGGLWCINTRLPPFTLPAHRNQVETFPKLMSLHPHCCRKLEIGWLIWYSSCTMSWMFGVQILAGQEICSSEPPDWLWSPLSLLWTGYRVFFPWVKWLGCKSEQLTLSKTEVTVKWNCTSTFPLCLHGLCGVTFSMIDLYFMSAIFACPSPS